jgi:hypothetical protein
MFARLKVPSGMLRSRRPIRQMLDAPAISMKHLKQVTIRRLPEMFHVQMFLSEVMGQVVQPGCRFLQPWD